MQTKTKNHHQTPQKKQNKTPELLHHGLCSEEFTPRYIGTDYFAFFHMPCRNNENYGHCKETAILADNAGRVIFNLQCKDCGKIDALKTGAFLWNPQRSDEEELEVFHLSPKLASRISRHQWDNI
jgi:hypothetical protein